MTFSTDPMSHVDRSAPNAITVFFQIYLVMFTGIALALWAAGTPIDVSARLSLYALITFTVAGLGFVNVGLLKNPRNIDIILCAILIGIAVLPAIAFIAYFAGLFYLMNLLIFVLFLALWFALPPWEAESGPVDFGLLYVPVIFASVVAPLGVLFSIWSPGEVAHASFQVIIAQSLAAGWPPESRLIAGAPLAYNFGAHLLLVPMAQAAGISIDALANKAIQTLILWFTIWGFMVLGACWLRLSWFANIAAATALFVVFGTGYFNFGALLRALTYTGSLTMSPLLGTLIFLVTLFVYLQLQERREHRTMIAGLILLTMLAFSTSIVRSTSGLLIALTTSLFWLYRTARQRRVDVPMTASTFVVGVASIAGVVATLGVPGSFSGANFARFSFIDGVSMIGSHPRLAYAQLIEWGISPFAAGLIGFAVMGLLAAHFLSPFLWGQVSQWRRRGAGDSEVALLMAFALGLLVMSVTVAPGLSHSVIGLTGGACGTLLGAYALDRYLKTKRHVGSSRIVSMTKYASLFLISGGVLAVHAHEAIGHLPVRPVLQRAFDHGSFYERPRVNQGADVDRVVRLIEESDEINFILPPDIIHQASWDIVARNNMSLLYEPIHLGFYSRYGGSEGAALKRFATVAAAFGAQYKEEKLDLEVARTLIETSLRPDERVVVLSSGHMEVIADPAFRLVAEDETISAWVYVPNESGVDMSPEDIRVLNMRLIREMGRR